MRRACLLLILSLLGVIPSFAAEGPDDLYVQVYQLIQDGDRLQMRGETAPARTSYLDAYNRLARLQTAYPRWNDSVVQFRLNDLVEKLRAMPADPTALAPRGGVQPPARPAGTGPGPLEQPLPANAELQIRELQNQVQRLKDENSILQVKLTEALSARAASIDPQELRKAEQRILSLEKEKEILAAVLEREKSRGTAAGAAASTAAVEEALKSSRAELAKQIETTNRLVRENEVLQVRLRDAERQLALARQTPAPPATAPPVTAPVSNQRPAPAPTPAPPPSSAPSSPDEVTRLQAELAILRLEKQTLEESQRDLQARLAGRSTNSANSTMPGASRDEVIRQVNTTSRDMLENQARTEAVERELASLKNRVQVLEAERVPYTREELALFQPPALDLGRTNRNRPRTAPREYPVRDQRLFDQVRVDFEARRYPEAERTLTEMLRTDTGNVMIMGSLATTQIQQRRFTEAEATLSRALRVDPTSPDILKLFGKLSYDQKKFDAALDYFSRSAQLDPRDPETLNYLGITLAEKGQRRAAETSVRRAIEVFPAYDEAHYNLAVIYASQDPPFAELARWHYQKAISLGYRANPELQKKIEQGAGAGSTAPPRP